MLHLKINSYLLRPFVIILDRCLSRIRSNLHRILLLATKGNYSYFGRICRRLPYWIYYLYGFGDIAEDQLDYLIVAALATPIHLCTSRPPVVARRRSHRRGDIVGRIETHTYGHHWSDLETNGANSRFALVKNLFH